LDCGFSDKGVVLPKNRTWVNVIELNDVMFIPYSNNYSFSKIYVVIPNGSITRITINDDFVLLDASSAKVENQIPVPPFTKIKKFKIEAQLPSALAYDMTKVFTLGSDTNNSSLYYINW
jgi:hypothetical protein